MPIEFAPKHDGNSGVPMPASAQDSQSNAIFVVKPNTVSEVADRNAPYYPDPAARQLVIELLTRTRVPTRVEFLLIDLYAPDCLQAAPSVNDGGFTVTCAYPNVLPLLLQVETMTDAVADQPGLGRWGPRLLTPQIGFADEHGDFTVLAPYKPGYDQASVFPGSRPLWRPAEGTQTMQRVRVRLAPGESFDVRVWAIPDRGSLNSQFAIPEHAGRLIRHASVGTTVDPRTDQTQESDELKKGLKAILNIEAPTQLISPSDLTNAIADQVAFLTLIAPLPGVSEWSTLRVTHATACPPKPAIPLDNDALSDCPPADPARDGGKTPPALAIQILRKNFKDDAAWAAWLKANPDWSDQDDLGATMTWFGGLVRVGLSQTGPLVLTATYRDVSDEPGQPLPGEMDDGRPVYPLVTREIWRSRPLPDELPVQAGAEFGDLDVIDLAATTEGEPRNLFHSFEDPRARLLFLKLCAISRFTTMMREAGQPPLEGPFRNDSDYAPVWMPATKRPDPMSEIELLPVFVWSEEIGSGGRALDRKTMLRVQWRRFERSDGVPQGRWFSSGEDERFALLLPPTPSGNGDTGPGAEDRPELAVLHALGPRSDPFAGRRQPDAMVDPGAPPAESGSARSRPGSAQMVAASR